MTLKDHPRLRLTAIGIGKMDFDDQHFAGVEAYDSKDFVVKKRIEYFLSTSSQTHPTNFCRKYRFALR